MSILGSSPLRRGLALALVQLLLVAGLGAKMLIDRSRLPRAWARTLPVDPLLPIRGRYVQLVLEAEARGFPQETPRSYPAVLLAENGRLVVEPLPDEHSQSRWGNHWINLRENDRQRATFFSGAVPFFIPEHVPDPSQRPDGEELWAEVTLPRRGPPRPIRLGIKRGDGPIEPLDLN